MTYVTPLKHRPRRPLLDVGRKANRTVSLKGITDTEATGIHELGTVFQPSRTRWRKFKLRRRSPCGYSKQADSSPNQTTNFGTYSLSQRVLGDPNTWIKF